MIDFQADLPLELQESEVAYNANRELNMAWDIVEETGANLFLTGRAGTGKTTFLKKLREDSSKNMVVLAPTGVAAINAAGNTLHSFFQLPFSPYVPGKGFVSNDKKFLNMSRLKRRLISSLSLLVIDEISMVRPDTLDAIDSILRRLRNSSRPFGGLQLLLIGDLRQLPPVVKDEEWNLLKDYYASPYFFESQALKKAGFKTVELTVVYRQSDVGFLEILNAIRDGKAGYDILEKLNTRCRPGFNPPDSEGYIRLTTHNRTATAINDRRLADLPSETFIFEAEIEGDFPPSAYPADVSLQLKKGAQVMFVKNDVGVNRRFYNGLIGTVTSLSEDKICVLPLGGGNLIEVTPMEWENTRYAVNETTGNVMQETVGTFRQYPLQLAWAITIHKSQGLTFDRAIIDATHSFAAGQTYVALSRCRSLEGMVLDAPVPSSSVIIDREVNDFIDYCEANAPDAAMVNFLKNDYVFTLLTELFDFEPLRRDFEDFARRVREYIVPIHPEVEPELDSFRQRIEKEICGIGRKFIDALYGKPVSDMLGNPDSNLEERIRNGCEYFYNITQEIFTFLHSLPRDIENSAYAAQLNNTFDNLFYNLGIKDAILELMMNKVFSVSNYLDTKARAVVYMDEAMATNAALKKSSGKKNSRRFKNAEKKEKKEKKPKGYSTFQTLDLFRQGKSIPEIAKERGLTEGTIGHHIEQLIALDRIRKEEVASPELIALVKRIREENPEAAGGAIFEAVNTSLPTPIPYYLLRICLV